MVKVSSSTMEVDMIDMLMDEGCDYDQYSRCSSSSTMEDENIGCNWNNWSPGIDWNPFPGDADDFHGLIESMMCSDKNTNVDWNVLAGSELVCEPSSTTTSEGTPPPAHPTQRERLVKVGDDKGLHLVHLLIAAAEALKGPDRSLDLTRVILVRLRELVSPAAAGGTNMERLAAHFTNALQGLLDGPTRARLGGGSHHDPQYQHGDLLGALQLLQDMSPYVKFGHFTANQAILESVKSDRKVHVVDYDIMEGVQWASLMQAMVSSKDGPPPPHLRITAITRGSSGGSGRKSMVTVHETGRRLAAFAASIGQPFSFGQCRLDPDEKFRPSAVKVVKGETVIANCVLHPPHGSTTSVASFLTGAATLGAKIITLVEEEREVVKGDDTKNGFVGRFMDELHRYSAIWDSLEAGFPMQGWARGVVERVILGPRITDAIARAYHQNEEENGEEGSWGDWMSSMGFGGVGLSFFSHCQARLLLGLFNDGYNVKEYAPNKLVLGWKFRRLISASIWSSPSPSPPPSTTTNRFTY